LLVCAAGIGGLGVFRASVRVVNADLPTGERVEEIVGTLGIPLIIAALAIVIYGLGEAQAHRELESQSLRDAINELSETIEQLPTAVQTRLPKTPPAVDSSAAPAPPAAPVQRAIAFAPIAPPVPPDGAPQLAASMRDALIILKEIRELSLMNESQRQQRYAVILKQRRETLMADVMRQIQSGHWTAASQTIRLLENDFQDDPTIIDLKTRVERGRAAAETREVEAIRGRIEDLMAIGNWDQAHALAMKFNENFPHNAEGAQLLARVERERQAFVEATANRLYSEIKADIDRREWRKARRNAEKLLEMFPKHPRSDKLRPQLQTIRDNAEIQERQEQEHRIQELVRSKQFAQAIELAEEVIDDFPGSPQAESLQAMLPKMRELALQEAVDAEQIEQ
jgi:tetratricopeptide (TPR) repeat protein